MSQPDSTPVVDVPLSPKMFTPTCTCKCPSLYRYGSIILASLVGFAVGVTVGRTIKN
jgi:hypothetical protein